ncbi:hypothetical protein RYZ27_02775 [Hyphomonas sp. FCG-A18]|uniref:hypothetical protein n=1 Tax=Hyphomonas sp. FCG-A18 TaxID=3080019 RepID=UPI002B296D3A|nr:hypothetical protein RYZ27_02775 [Hyphomonas sp. FCG-A18]
MTRVKNTLRRWRRIRTEKARLAAIEKMPLTMHKDHPSANVTGDDILIDPSRLGQMPTRIRPT